MWGPKSSIILPSLSLRAMCGAAALMLAAAVSLHAHHSLTAEYDPRAPLTLVGPITKVELMNPHSFVELELTTTDGKVETWRVEVGSPATLVKHKISRKMLAIGTVVTVDGFRAKNGSRRAFGAHMTFPNGETKKLDEDMLQSAPDPGPPTFLQQILISLPFLPYVVGALPVVVLLLGVYVVRRRPR